MAKVVDINNGKKKRGDKKGKHTYSPKSQALIDFVKNLDLSKKDP